MCRETETHMRIPNTVVSSREPYTLQPDNLDKISPLTFFPVQWLVLMCCCCCCQHPANFCSQLTRAIFRREAKMNGVLCGKRAIGANIRTQKAITIILYRHFRASIGQHIWQKRDMHALLSHARVCCMDLGFRPDNVNFIFKPFWSIWIHANHNVHTVRLETIAAPLKNIFEPNIVVQWPSDYHGPDFCPRYMLRRLQGTH